MSPQSITLRLILELSKTSWETTLAELTTKRCGTSLLDTELISVMRRRPTRLHLLKTAHVTSWELAPRWDRTGIRNLLASIRHSPNRTTPRALLTTKTASHSAPFVLDNCEQR